MSRNKKPARVIALIPARGGSKGVPKKNIRNLAGYPLIAYSIIAGVLSSKIDRVMVSTDSEEIADISRKYGAEVPYLRPSEYAGDKSPDIEFMAHALEWLGKNEGQVPEYFVHLRPTTPLREPTVIDSAIEMISQDAEATSLRSGHPAPESPFKWFLRSEAGYFTGIMPGIDNETVNRPRQAFPVVYIPDGYVDVIKTSLVKNSGILHGEKMIGFVSPVCQEIDTLEDFKRLEYESQKEENSLLKYLKTNFPGGR